jgi:hypothetical protein
VPSTFISGEGSGFPITRDVGDYWVPGKPGFGFLGWISRDHGDSNAARRKAGAPDEPGFGLAGWNFAALQTVILNERRMPEVKDLNRRSPPSPSLGIPPHRRSSQNGIGLSSQN